MGYGIIFKCNKCNKEYNFELGEGMMSRVWNFQYKLYICPKCGNWEHKRLPIKECLRLEALKDVHTAEEFLKIHKSFENYEDEKVICDECKIQMDYYDTLDYDKNLAKYENMDSKTQKKQLENPEKNPFLPKMICKECNGILERDSIYCWD